MNRNKLRKMKRSQETKDESSLQLIEMPAIQPDPIKKQPYREFMYDDANLRQPFETKNIKEQAKDMLRFKLNLKETEAIFNAHAQSTRELMVHYIKMKPKLDPASIIRESDTSVSRY